jgi:hypothetical protein
MKQGRYAAYESATRRHSESGKHTKSRVGHFPQYLMPLWAAYGSHWFRRRRHTTTKSQFILALFLARSLLLPSLHRLGFVAIAADQVSNSPTPSPISLAVPSNFSLIPFFAGWPRPHNVRSAEELFPAGHTASAPHKLVPRASKQSRDGRSHGNATAFGNYHHVGANGRGSRR